MQDVQEWRNWSGSLRFRPQRFEQPESEQALVELVRRAAADGQTVRVVGAGHSSSRLVETEDLLVSLEKLNGLQSHDRDHCVATLGAGTRVEDAGKALHEVGLALHNYGDVATQTLAGVIGTGTHGSGKMLPNLSAALVGVRLVTGRGELQEYTFDREPGFLQAARVSLGALGIFTAVTLKLLPTYRIHRQEWCTHIDKCMDHLDELIELNRGFDFYWYPRRDEAKLRLLNPPGEGPGRLPYAQCVAEEEGWSHEVIPKHSGIANKFDEMEYALPAEAGPACFQEVRRRMKEKHRAIVGWRVLYRTIAADDAYLSPAQGRPTVTISLHQNAGLPFWEFFLDLEPVFRAYGGRPHWGKKHTLGAAELRPLYPLWDRFEAERRRMDPGGVFLSPAMRDLLGVG